MLNERLQVMISLDQRRRLEDEARRRDSSVATVVREAIDDRLGVPTREERRDAVAAIAAMNGRYLSPGELEEIVDEERVKAVRAR